MKLVRWLEKNTLVEKDFTILDIGCGNGMTLIEMVKKITLVILDNENSRVLTQVTPYC